ncbi:alpha/beta fold hydrolase [Chloroflexota bacterium]
MPSVTVNGVEINYVEQGSGDEVVIFAHGYFSAKENWKEVLELLPNEYHAYVLDQRGHGQSGRPGSYQLTEFVEDIYAFSQELGIERFTYVGHSMGGKIGMKFALDHPDVLKALVLVCPVIAFALPPDQVSAILERNTATMATPETIRGYLEWEMAKPISEERINDTVNNFMVVDRAVIAEWAEYNLFTDLMPQPWEIRAPTFVVAGAKDKTVPLDTVRPTINAIKGSHLEVFEDCSHFLPMESPQELVDMITSLIKDVSKGSL